ncbi:MAG: hypothetical protein GY861_22130 [bacterium]|nr:hypothetical protein [bacterium]
MMKEIDSDRIQVRVRIEGTYDYGDFMNYKPFVYEDSSIEEGSQFYFKPHTDNNDTDKFKPYEYWWTDGNMGCDCNRCKFVRIDDLKCGDTIYIDRVISLETYKGIELPILELNESIERH